MGKKTQRNNHDQSYESETLHHYQDMSVAREYDKQFATVWSLRNFSHALVAKAERRAVRLLLNLIRTKVKSVLDVPAGTGKLIPVFCEMGLSVIQGDVSRPMMVFARAKTQELDLSWPLVCLDLTKLPFAPNSADAVVCLRLLHRVPLSVKRDALLEIARVSRGYAIVSYGIQNRWHSLRQAIRRSLTRTTTTVPEPIGRAEMDSLLHESGWRVLRRVNPLPVVSAEEIALLFKRPDATSA